MKLFTRHPNSIGEGYFKHLSYAILTAIKLIFASFFLIIHAVFPFVFTNTASNIIITIYNSIIKRLPKSYK